MENFSMTEPRLTKHRDGYKPFDFPWAYDHWKTQQQVHWLPEEVPLGEDVKDWEHNLTDAERHLVTQIFRFFTQADVEVNDCYHRNYLRIFKPTEVVMMLTAFSNMETIHVAAYSHLLETIGMPETEYSAFMDYEEMKEKSDFMRAFNPDDPHGVALTLATFGAFVEGLQLFASFAILMNFPRFNKMKGMGQIVSWSVRDETLHMSGVVSLFHEWVREHWDDIDATKLADDIRDACLEVVRHEDAFIDLAFEAGEIQGLSPEEMKSYIRYIANQRMEMLHLPPVFEDAPQKNPLPWLEEILNGVEHANFFEARATEYSKGSLTGDWDKDAYV
jgi:ribonucleoside-diphosphate reductase beta chain